jgi:hypothetical protein
MLPQDDTATIGGKGADAFMSARFIVVTRTGCLQAKPQHLSVQSFITVRDSQQ